MFVLSVLDAPNTKTNSLCVQTLGNKALSVSDYCILCNFNALYQSAAFVLLIELPFMMAVVV